MNTGTMHVSSIWRRQCSCTSRTNTRLVRQMMVRSSATFPDASSRSVDVEEAKRLLERGGYKLLDIRCAAGAWWREGAHASVDWHIHMLSCTHALKCIWVSNEKYNLRIQYHAMTKLWKQWGGQFLSSLCLQFALVAIFYVLAFIHLKGPTYCLMQIRDRLWAEPHHEALSNICEYPFYE